MQRLQQQQTTTFDLKCPDAEEARLFRMIDTNACGTLCKEGDDYYRFVLQYEDKTCICDHVKFGELTDRIYITAANYDRLETKHVQLGAYVLISVNLF